MLYIKVVLEVSPEMFGGVEQKRVLNRITLCMLAVIQMCRTLSTELKAVKAVLKSHNIPSDFGLRLCCKLPSNSMTDFYLFFSVQLFVEGMELPPPSQ